MSLQSTLFDDLPDLKKENQIAIGKATRNAAYRSIKPSLSGKRGKVYEVILAHGIQGITRKGIASELGWPINCVTGRVTELRDIYHLIKEEGIVPSPSHDGRVFANGVLKAL